MGFLDQKMHEYMLRAHDNFDPPVTLATNKGEISVHTHRYRSSFRTLVGETTGSETVSVTNCVESLDGANFVELKVTDVPKGVKAVRYFKYREISQKFELIGEVTQAPWVLNDTGLASRAEYPAIENTSGRPDWQAILWRPGRTLQRPELQDASWIHHRDLKNVADRIHKQGDIIEGCNEQKISGTTWRFLSGKVYIDGQYVRVPKGQATLKGLGKETVGLRITPVALTDNDDPYLRNLDEGVDIEYCEDGAHRLAYRIEWVVDEPGMVPVREFVDNAPLLVQIVTERSELVKMMERRTYDTSGDYVVRKFPLVVEQDVDNPANLKARILAGKAYVTGAELETIGAQTVDIPKARDTDTRESAVLGSYIATGGLVIASRSQNYDVNGLKIKLRIGSGNSFTITLAGSGQSSEQVATQVKNVVNAYPTSGVLLYGGSSSGKLYLQAIDGKDLTIEAVAQDAYSVLGINPGIYVKTGQRIYPMGDSFIKSTSRFSFITEEVEAITHNGTDHIDALGNENVQDIIGVSTGPNGLADCHDNRFQYTVNNDFIKSGNNLLNFKALSGNRPGDGDTLYVKYTYARNASKVQFRRIRIENAQLTKTSDSGKDNIVYDGGTAYKAVTGERADTPSGFASNVIRVLKVTDYADTQESDYTSFRLLKNSDGLGHSTSQIDWSAAGIPGQTGDGQPTLGQKYFVSFEAWQVVTNGDYAGPESYVDDYEQIEYAPNGAWHLRDCVDFRTSGAKPIPGDGARLDYQFYLGRIDKIAMTSDGHFIRIAGAPAINPLPPSNQTGPMSTHQLAIPPYTYSPSDVTKQTLEIQRKTQHAINEMDARIARLEYYQAKTRAAARASDSEAAMDAKGIFGDSLLGTAGGDVGFSRNGVAFDCAVDPFEQCIRLAVDERGERVRLDETNSLNIGRIGSVLVFDYSEAPYISQLRASSITPANPHQVFGWIGQMELDPSSDFWTDTRQVPALDLNYDEQYSQLQLIEAENAERARAITWSAWALTWDRSGGWAAKTWGEGVNTAEGALHWLGNQSAEWVSRHANAARERYGTYKSLVPERTLVELDDRVVDMTVLPYIRTTINGGPFYISVMVHGLKPLSEYACSIDGVLVDLIPVGSSMAGAVKYKGSYDTMAADGSGSFMARFAVPQGITVGQKPIKVFKRDNEQESYAISVFTSQGFLETRQKRVMGILSVSERDETLTQTQWHYGDPLAQTFSVTEGIKWISGVRLAFAEKDPTLPVTVDVREVVNGYPTRKVIQTRTLYPEDIVTSGNGKALTTFRFSNPVGYGPGEYCFVVVTNSLEYKLWQAVLGETDTDGVFINSQPYDGVQFESPNDSTWVAHVDRDLTFEILTCNFQQNARIEFEEVSGVQASLLCLAVTTLMPQGCTMHWTYRINEGSVWKAFEPFINDELGSVATSVKIRCDVQGVGGTFAIDESGAGIILALNRQRGNYISKQATLSEDCDSVTMYVDLAVDGVNGAGTRTAWIYYSIDDGKHWVKIHPSAFHSPVAVGDGTYREWKFETPVEVTVSGASNANPVVMSVPGHTFSDGAVVVQSGISGNTAANGTFRIRNCTDSGYELLDPDTGNTVGANGNYESGGIVRLAPFRKCRGRIELETSNRAVTPKGKEIRIICN